VCPQEIQGARITASFGVTQVSRHDDQKSVLERADRDLYQAKNAGRNCVVTLTDASDTAPLSERESSLALTN